MANWYRNEFEPFVEAALEYPDEVGYAALSADPRPTVSPATGRMAVQLQMQGILR